MSILSNMLESQKNLKDFNKLNMSRTYKLIEKKRTLETKYFPENLWGVSKL